MFYTLFVPLSNIFHVINEVVLAPESDPNAIIVSSWWLEFHHCDRNLQIVSALYPLPVHQDCTVGHHQYVIALERQKAQKSRAIALDFSAFWLSRLRHNNQRRRESNHTESHTLQSALFHWSCSIWFGYLHIVQYPHSQSVFESQQFVPLSPTEIHWSSQRCLPFYHVLNRYDTTVVVQMGRLPQQ